MIATRTRSARAAITLLAGLLVGGFLGGGTVWVLNRNKFKDTNTVADVSLAKADELDLVPADSVGFAHVRLADLWKTDAMTEFRKVLEKAGPEAIKAFDEGFVPAPSSADRLTVFGFKGSNAATPPPPPPLAKGGFPPPPVLQPFVLNAPHICGILAFSAPFDEVRVREANLPKAVEQTAGGKKYWSDSRSGLAIHFHSDRVMVVGSPLAVQDLLARSSKKEGPMANALARAAGGTRHIVAAASTSMAGNLTADLPQEFQPLLRAESVSVGLVLGSGAKIDLRASYPNAAAAESAETALRAAAAEGRKKLGEMKKKLELSVKGEPDVRKVRSVQELPEAVGSLFGLGALNTFDEWLADPPLTREGSEIAATFTTGSMGSAYMGVAAMSVGILLPAVQKVREAAGRATDSNNLKQIGVAMHNYASANQDKYPDAAWSMKRDPQKPFLPPPPHLSWRVAILPYIEQDILYRQFKLDEPWDSEHNKKLIPLMPKTFATPLMSAEPGKTYYKVFVSEGVQGPGAMFHRPRNRYTIGNIPDGTSNTIMVAEGGDPVIWTKPDDFEFDPKKPLPRIAQPGRPGFNVLMGDGSVRFVSVSVSENTLKYAIQADEGMVLGPDW